eukprot:g2762.t1
MNEIEEDFFHPKPTPKPGKWVIHVHVHELRGLKSVAGTSVPQPILDISVFDKREVVNLEAKGFDCKVDITTKLRLDLTEDDIKSGQILFSVRHKNLIGSSHIGSYSFDIQNLYDKPNHEHAVQWFALTDTLSNPPCQGVRGYARLTIAALGPGDNLKVRSLEEIEKMLDKDFGSGNDIIVSPTVESNNYKLFAYVFKAKDLPQLDKMLEGNKIDPYVKLNCRAGSVESSAKRQDFDPVFNELLTLPVKFPRDGSSSKLPPTGGIVNLTVLDQDLASRLKTGIGNALTNTGIGNVISGNGIENTLSNTLDDICGNISVPTFREIYDRTQLTKESIEKKREKMGWERYLLETVLDIDRIDCENILSGLPKPKKNSKQRKFIVKATSLYALQCVRKFRSLDKNKDWSPFIANNRTETFQKIFSHKEKEVIRKKLFPERPCSSQNEIEGVMFCKNCEGTNEENTHTSEICPFINFENYEDFEEYVLCCIKIVRSPSFNPQEVPLPSTLRENLIEILFATKWYNSQEYSKSKKHAVSYLSDRFARNTLCYPRGPQDLQDSQKSENIEIVRVASQRLMGPFRYSMYGPQEGIEGETANFMKTGRYEGTCYRGSIEIGLEADFYEPDFSGLDKYEISPKKSFKLVEDREANFYEVDGERKFYKVKEANYVVSVMFLKGCEINCGTLANTLGERNSVKAIISIGNNGRKNENEIKSKSQIVENGCVTFDDEFKQQEMELPLDPFMIPDIMIYIENSDGDRISYRRFSVAEVFPELRDMKYRKKNDLNIKRITRKRAQWVALKEDKAMNKISYGDFPGFLLLGGGGDESKEILTPYRLLARIYQGKKFEAKDETGLSDPYVTVRCGHFVVGNTKARPETLNPLYYKVLGDASLVWLEEPRNLRHAPPIRVSVTDANKYASDELIGEFFAWPDDAYRNYLKERSYSEKKRKKIPPTWQSLLCEGETTGELLCSFVLEPVVLVKNTKDKEYKYKVCRKNNNNKKAYLTETDTSFRKISPLSGSRFNNKLINEIIEANNVVSFDDINNEEHYNSIRPKMKDCYVMINTLGMRDLKSSLVYGIKKPYARFDLGTKDTIWKTQPNAFPTSRNPQLQPSQKAIKAKLPIENEDDFNLYAPMLSCNVFDSSLFGIEYNLGTSYISLNDPKICNTITTCMPKNGKSHHKSDKLEEKIMNMISSEKTYNKVSNDIKRPKKICYVIPHNDPSQEGDKRMFDLYGLHFTTKIKDDEFLVCETKMLKARWGNIELKDAPEWKGKRAVYPYELKNVSKWEGKRDVYPEDQGIEYDQFTITIPITCDKKPPLPLEMSIDGGENYTTSNVLVGVPYKMDSLIIDVDIGHSSKAVDEVCSCIYVPTFEELLFYDWASGRKETFVPFKDLANKLMGRSEIDDKEVEKKIVNLTEKHGLAQYIRTDKEIEDYICFIEKNLTTTLRKYGCSLPKGKDDIPLDENEAKMWLPYFFFKNKDEYTNWRMKPREIKQSDRESVFKQAEVVKAMLLNPGIACSDRAVQFLLREYWTYNFYMHSRIDLNPPWCNGTIPTPPWYDTFISLCLRLAKTLFRHSNIPNPHGIWVKKDLKTLCSAVVSLEKKKQNMNPSCQVSLLRLHKLGDDNIQNTKIQIELARSPFDEDDFTSFYANDESQSWTAYMGVGQPEQDFKNKWGKFVHHAKGILKLSPETPDVCFEIERSCKCVYHCTCPRLNIGHVNILKKEVITESISDILGEGQTEKRDEKKRRCLSSTCKSKRCRQRYQGRQKSSNYRQKMLEMKKESLIHDATDIPIDNSLQTSYYPYLQDRESFHFEIENAKDSDGNNIYQAPFSLFELKRGKGKRQKTTGYIKAFISIREHENEEKDDKEKISREKKTLIEYDRQWMINKFEDNPEGEEVVARFYILRILHIISKSHHGKDIYVKLSFGGSSGQNYIITPSLFDLKTLKIHKNVKQLMNFFECIQIEKLKFPGTSVVYVSIMQKRSVLSDLEIGKTKIDLENMWFSRRWAMIPHDKKPLEYRSLSNIQSDEIGKMELFVDMFRQTEVVPMTDIALPPQKEFELRLIIWKAIAIPTHDSSGLIDMYIKVTLTGMNDETNESDSQSTDTHLRAENGEGSFNFRMKFDLNLPLKDPRLKFEVYDQNLASSDDAISSACLSLREISKKAYFTNSTQGWDKREIILNHPDTDDQFAQMEKKIRVQRKRTCCGVMNVKKAVSVKQVILVAARRIRKKRHFEI